MPCTQFHVLTCSQDKVQVTEGMVGELRDMIKEGTEVRVESKLLLEEMLLEGLVLWESHTEEHREGHTQKAVFSSLFHCVVLVVITQVANYTFSTSGNQSKPLYYMRMTTSQNQCMG